MVKNLNNNQLLINEIIRQEYGENKNYSDEDTFFEYFAAQQVLKNYDLSYSEIEQGLTGASLDGGCDGIYFFVNGDLISEDDDVVEKYKKDVKLVFCIIQAKNTISFKETPLSTWKTTCDNLLNLNNAIDQFKDRYNSKVLQAFELFKDTFIKLLRKKHTLRFEFKYVTKGIEIHPNVKAQADELCSKIKDLFPAPTVSAVVDFIDADKLMELVSMQVNNEFF